MLLCFNYILVISIILFENMKMDKELIIIVSIVFTFEIFEIWDTDKK